MANFETDRLICRSLTLREYKSFEDGKEPEWGTFSNPFNHLTKGPSPLIHRIPLVKKNPEFAEIGLVLAISKEERILVGSAGFHDFPDDKGMIEIGFGIVPQRQNLGFGLELLKGMWKFISSDPKVKILRYTVSPNNEPSMHLICKLGFKKVGEQIDEEDGLELIYEESISECLAKMS